MTICLECFQEVTDRQPKYRCDGTNGHNGCKRNYHQTCVSSFTFSRWRCKNPDCKCSAAQNINPIDRIMAQSIDAWVAQQDSWLYISALLQRRRTFSTTGSEQRALQAAVDGVHGRASWWWQAWAKDQAFRKCVLIQICSLMRQTVLGLKGIQEDASLKGILGTSDTHITEKGEVIKGAVSTLINTPVDATALGTIMRWNDFFQRTKAVTLPDAEDLTTQVAAEFADLFEGDFVATTLGQQLNALGINAADAGAIVRAPQYSRLSIACRLSTPLLLLIAALLFLFLPVKHELPATGTTPAPSPWTPGPVPAEAVTGFGVLKETLHLGGTITVLVIAGLIWILLFLQLNWSSWRRDIRNTLCPPKPEQRSLLGGPVNESVA